MKVTIPKPGKERESEDEENEGQNVETELREDGGAESDLAKSIDAGEEKGEEDEAAPKETLDANDDQNGAENNEGNGDEVRVGKEEEEEDDAEENEEDVEKKAKSGAKSTTVIIARTHPGESNTSFIVQGQSDRGRKLVTELE